MNASFFIPLLYTYTTRLQTVPKAISLFIIYFIPVCVLLYFLHPEISQFHFWMLAMLAIVGVYTVYEIGYIQNDTETIKLEKKPTMRLSSQQLDFYAAHRIAIYAVRCFELSIVLLFIYCIIGMTGTKYYTIGILAILLLYQFYNRGRGHVNMFLYLILVSLRYLVPLLLFPSKITWPLILCGLMIFPIPKTLMYRAGSPKHVKTNIFFRKYILKWDLSRIEGVRVIVCTLLTIIAFCLYKACIFPILYIYLFIYMLTYRLLLYLAGKIKLINPMKLR